MTTAFMSLPCQLGLFAGKHEDGGVIGCGLQELVNLGLNILPSFLEAANRDKPITLAMSSPLSPL